MQNTIEPSNTTEPVTGCAVYECVQAHVSNIGGALGNIQSELEYRIRPAINLLDNPSAQDGSILQLVNGIPTWVAIINGNEVAY